MQNKKAEMYIYIYTIAYINPRSITWQKDIKLVIIILQFTQKKYNKIKLNISRLGMISGFHLEVAKNCDILGYYAE